MAETELLPTADKLDRLEAMLRERGIAVAKAIGHLMKPGEIPLETLAADEITRLRAELLAQKGAKDGIVEWAYKEIGSLNAALSAAEKMSETLKWYGENARLCRLIHSEGDAGRHALNDDGGKRARAALADFESSRDHRRGEK